MKKILIGLTALASISAFASDSIILKMTDATGFGVDTYTIPSTDGESADQSLLVLANVLSRDVCYTGKVAKVKIILDATVDSAKNVKQYSSFVSKNTLSVDLTVFNKNLHSNQRNQLVVDNCKN